MENQAKLIKGYRDLTEQEIDLMNRIKEQGEKLGELVAELQASHKAEAEALQVTPDFSDVMQGHIDARRWTSIGQTHLQQGLMALVRAVGRPTNF